MRSLLVAFCLSLPIAAQSAGYQDFSFPNTTGQGSATIPSRVYYPATSSGLDAPLLPAPGGHPVVVFLHGQGRLGNDYSLAGDHLASRGYVVVLPNTGQFTGGVVRLDGIALFSVLQTINGVPGHFLEGALDMSRAGLAGHSVGGGNTVVALATDPGYVAGLCFAPLFPGQLPKRVYCA